MGRLTSQEEDGDYLRRPTLYLTAGETCSLDCRFGCAGEPLTQEFVCKPGNPKYTKYTFDKECPSASDLASGELHCPQPAREFSLVGCSPMSTTTTTTTAPAEGGKGNSTEAAEESHVGDEPHVHTPPGDQAALPPGEPGTVVAAETPETTTTATTTLPGSCRLPPGCIGYDFVDAENWDLRKASFYVRMTCQRPNYVGEAVVGVCDEVGEDFKVLEFFEGNSLRG